MSPGWNAVTARTLPRAEPFDAAAAAGADVRFGIAVQTGKLLKKATLDVMWTQGQTTAGEATGYGLGWGVQPPQEGMRRISHNGNQIGASGGFIIIPEVELTYAVLTNLEDVEIPRFTRGIAQILRKHLMR